MATGWTLGSLATGSFATKPWVSIMDAAADNTGFESDAVLAGSTVKLWGPNQGSNNGFTGPPEGTYAVAANADDGKVDISQTFTGLSVGYEYTVTFQMAGSQEKGFSGAQVEHWDVTFCGDAKTSTLLNVPSSGFVGWTSESLTFTASSSSCMLVFRASSTPFGTSGWLLLDDVSMCETAVGS